MKDIIEQKVYLSQLFETYQDLLTEKQKKYFDLTINEDWSLNEIALHFSVSRNAVHDANQKTEKILLNFEAKLQIIAKKVVLNQILEEYRQSTNEETKMIIKQLEEVN